MLRVTEEPRGTPRAFQNPKKTGPIGYLGSVVSEPIRGLRVTEKVTALRFDIRIGRDTCSHSTRVQTLNASISSPCFRSCRHYCISVTPVGQFSLLYLLLCFDSEPSLIRVGNHRGKLWRGKCVVCLACALSRNALQSTQQSAKHTLRRIAGLHHHRVLQM